MKILILLLLLAPAGWATADQIEFQLGRGSPESQIQAGGSAESPGDRGDAWSVDWLHQPGARAYWGIGGGHFRSAARNSATFVPNNGATISSQSTSIFLLTRVDLTDPARLVPYLMAGTGWIRTSMTAVMPAVTLLDASRSSLGYAVGGGMDLAVTQRLFIGFEARYQSALQRNFDLTPEGQAITGQGAVQSTMKLFLLGVKAGFKY